MPYCRVRGVSQNKQKQAILTVNYVVVFEWNRLLSYQQIFLRNQMETRQENVNF